ncbi:hypothetical protein [Mariniluteicoccus flavus]
MGRVALYAVGIDEIRDLIGATPETAERVRPLADELWPWSPPARPGLWNRLTRRTPDPVHRDPAAPTPEDIDGVLTGRYATPDRAGAAWMVVEGLTGRLARDQLHLDLESATVEGFDYALARAGAPSEAGLGRLLRADARLGLAPAPGRRACYLPGTDAVRGAALLADLDIADRGHRELADRLRSFLAGFGQWPDADLVAFTG